MKVFLRRMAIVASYDLQWSSARAHLVRCRDGLQEALLGMATTIFLPFYLLLWWPLAPLRWAIAARRHGKRIDILGFRPRGKKEDPEHYK